MLMEGPPIKATYRLDSKGLAVNSSSFDAGSLGQMSAPEGVVHLLTSSRAGVINGLPRYLSREAKDMQRS